MNAFLALRTALRADVPSFVAGAAAARGFFELLSEPTRVFFCIDAFSFFGIPFPRRLTASSTSAKLNGPALRYWADWKKSR